MSRRCVDQKRQLTNRGAQGGASYTNSSWFLQGGHDEVDYLRGGGLRQGAEKKFRGKPEFFGVSPRNNGNSPQIRTLPDGSCYRRANPKTSMRFLRNALT